MPLHCGAALCGAAQSQALMRVCVFAGIKRQAAAAQSNDTELQPIRSGDNTDEADGAGSGAKPKPKSSCL